MESVHPCLGVLDARDFGTEITSFSFTDDGTPLIDSTAKYAFCSAELGIDTGNLTASAAFSHPDDEPLFIDSS
jgi:hypothetical protein